MLKKYNIWTCKTQWDNISVQLKYCRAFAHQLGWHWGHSRRYKYRENLSRVQKSFPTTWKGGDFILCNLFILLFSVFPPSKIKIPRSPWAPAEDAKLCSLQKKTFGSSFLAGESQSNPGKLHYSLALSSTLGLVLHYVDDVDDMTVYLQRNISQWRKHLPGTQFYKIVKHWLCTYE